MSHGEWFFSYIELTKLGKQLLLGRRSFVNRQGNRNMVDEDYNEGSGDTQDNTDVTRNEAEDAKMGILSNLKSMMSGEAL